MNPPRLGPPPLVAYVPRKKRRRRAEGSTPPAAEEVPAAKAGGDAVAWVRRLGQSRQEKDSPPEGVPFDRELSREERALVAARHLGSEGGEGKGAPLPPRKRGDRRLVFGWDAAEDTSVPADFGPPAPRRGIGESSRFGDLEEKGDSSAVDARGGRGAVWRDVPLEAMGEREWRIFNEDHALTMQGAPPGLRPARVWAESGLPVALLEAVKRLGYVRPTPVQMAAVPLGLAGHDLLVMAETGSGKTAAFLLPLLARVARLPRLNSETASLGPLALVLAPTRELAQQTSREAERLGDRLGVRVACVVGGGGQRSRDVQSLRVGQGSEVLVATPGRLLESLETSHLVLSQCSHLVLDEADRMLDMGFEPQVLSILGALDSSTQRTTQMFSATMPPAVERLARTYLLRPCRVQIGDRVQTAQTISQRVLFCADAAEKRSRLPELVRLTAPPVLVFANEKHTVDELARLLGRASPPVAAVAGLHGGLAQDAREGIMAGFRAGRIGVLVATDVAGRGIDVDNVRHVVGYDMAPTLEGYTHRIGRTGRAGKAGTATTLLTPADDRGDLFGQLRALLKRAGVADIPPQLTQRAIILPPHGRHIMD